MVQRLGIAQAFLGDPRLLVLDEPTSGLDPAGRKEVLDLLLAAKLAGKTVFLSSHILSEVEQICDRVVIIDRGRLVRTGRLREMMGDDNRIEILVDRLPEELEWALLQRGAQVERTSPAPRICLDASLKHEIMELFRDSNCEVISMKPVKSTLEEFFLKLVKNSGEGRMKIRAIALNTFSTLVRDKLIILFCVGFLCIVLLMMSPMLRAKSMARTMSPSQVEGMVVGMLSLIIRAASGFGSLLAAWSAADAVRSEIKSGTILAVLARPVRRWEFLLGKYLGVQLLMGIYVVFLVLSTYVLASIAGESMHPVVWALIVYPMVRLCHL